MKTLFLSIAFMGICCWVSVAQNEEIPVDSLIKFYKNEGQRLRSSDPQKAAEILHKGLQLSRKRNHKTDIGFFYRKLISQKGYAQQMDSAVYFFEEAMRNPEENGDFAIEGHLHSELAEAYYRNEDFEKAEHHFRMSDTAYTGVNDSIGIVIARSNTASLLQLRGDLQGAIQLMTESATMADTTQYRYIRANIFGSISSLYLEVEDLDNYRKYAEMAYTESKKDLYAEPIIENTFRFADANRLLGRYDEAEELVEESERVIDSLDLELYRVYIEKQRGLIARDLNRPDEAIAHMEEILELNKSFSVNTDEMMKVKEVLANLYMEKEQFSKGIQMLEDLKNLGEEQEVPRTLIDIYKSLSSAYEKTGNYNKALHYIHLHKKLNDSLFNLDRQNAFKEIETKYQMAEKEKDLAETRAFLAESELKVKRRNNMIYGSLGLALILGLLGYLFVSRQRLKNRQLKKESELKSALAKIETQNKLQEQRLRISRDLHDNIGSQLTFVTSSVDNLKFKMKGEDEKVTKKLGAISEFTTQTIYELRDTIWAMNKTEISFEDLQSRIANFMDKAGGTSDKIAFNFKTEGAISKDTVLTSIQGMNVYRIIQEAVNNSLKYADASSINVVMSKGNEEELTVIIADNGKGFDMDTVEKGNGLINMKKRARDVNGNVEINSQVGHGTKVQLTFKYGN